MARQKAEVMNDEDIRGQECIGASIKQGLNSVRTVMFEDKTSRRRARRGRFLPRNLKQVVMRRRRSIARQNAQVSFNVE